MRREERRCLPEDGQTNDTPVWHSSHNREAHREEVPVPSFALYYPWMRFGDDNWLKLALLTWDNIARIRPKGAKAGESDLVRRLQAEADLIVDIAPTVADRDAAASAFHDVHLGDLVDPADVRWADLLVRPSETSTRLDEPELVWIYGGTWGDLGRAGVGKVAYFFREELVELGLAINDPDGRDGPWLGMRPRMASIYLAVLADAIAQHNQLVPVTDDLRAHSAAGAIDNLAEMLGGELGPRRTLDTGEHAYLHLAVSAVIQPDRLDSVSAPKLIAFRQRYAAELSAFRQHVTGLGPELKKIAEVENLAVAQAHLQSLYDTQTRPQLNELRKALRSMGIESSAGVLGMKVDLGAAAGTALGSVMAASGQPAVGGAAIAITVLPYLASRYAAARTFERQSPVAYLLAVDRQLGGPALLRRLRGQRRTHRP